MSGVEVLGLVLGAIPLLISAFEHLRDACEARDMLIHFKAKHGKCWDDVKDEELVFRLHLQKLLLPLVKVDVLDNDEVDTLVLDAGGPGWRDADLDAALRRRLGEAHDRYREHLEDIPKILHKLLMTLGYRLSPFQERLQALQDARTESICTKTKILVQANARFLGQQIEFVARKASREELVSDLRTKIQKLETFLALSNEVTTLQEQNTTVSQKSIKALLQYGQQANCLYNLMYKCWRCTCRQSHYAHLLLQHQAGVQFEIKMLLLYGPKGSQIHMMPPWQQQGLQILQTDVQRILSQNQPVVCAAIQAAGCRQKRGIPALNKGVISRAKTGRMFSQPSVKFNLPPVQAAIQSEPSQKAGENQAASKKAKLVHNDEGASQTEIGDLCKTLASCGMVTGWVGSLTDPNLGRTYRVLSQPRHKVIADEISLHDILQASHRPRLSRLKRFQIALKVASSHLKLISTKWARTQWESRDIRFPLVRSRSGADAIMSDDPYVSADFRDRDSETERAPAKTDRSFACLGIMLLELLFGVTLEQHDLWLQLGPDKTTKALFRLMVARSWADAAEGETGKPFSSVIMWCLNESPATLEDDRWRKNFAERVVLPLEKCCEWSEARPS